MQVRASFVLLGYAHNLNYPTLIRVSYTRPSYPNRIGLTSVYFFIKQRFYFKIFLSELSKHSSTKLNSLRSFDELTDFGLFTFQTTFTFYSKLVCVEIFCVKLAVLAVKQDKKKRYCLILCLGYFLFDSITIHYQHKRTETETQMLLSNPKP